MFLTLREYYTQNRWVNWTVKGTMGSLTFYIFYFLLGPSISGCATTVTIPHTYVKSIDTPTYDNKEVKKILDEFNEMGNNDIVFYEGGFRAITIGEGTEDDGNVGEALPLPFNCDIRLSKTMHYKLMRETLLHEYLHCFGYDHVKEPGDLMYPTDMYPATETSIKEYAKRLRRKLYGPNKR